ncbi:hypothetical protein CC99x_012720 [Candidatus Berkiella cookevillensis]|nr:hypothetical protein [Candidatus Berkiella cookevillensis]MCS5709762.1 hypothetical protein [Candidatus Berkiella cookevillensis]
MKELNINEINEVSAGSVLGVLIYGTVGFWVGGFTGFCMGVWPAIPGSILGMTVGAYLGTDAAPQVIIIKESDYVTPY